MVCMERAPCSFSRTFTWTQKERERAQRTSFATAFLAGPGLDLLEQLLEVLVPLPPQTRVATTSRQEPEMRGECFAASRLRGEARSDAMRGQKDVVEADAICLDTKRAKA